MSLKSWLLCAAASAVLVTPSIADARKKKEPPALPMRTEKAEKVVSADFNMSRPAVRVVTLSGDFFALKPMGQPIPPSIANARVRIDFSGQDATFDDLMLLLEERRLPVVIGWDDGSAGGSDTPDLNGPPRPAPANGRELGTASQPSGTFSDTTQRETESAPASANLSTSGQDRASTAGGNKPVATDDAVRSLRRRLLPFRRYEGTLGGLFKRLQRSMGLSIWWQDGIYMSPVGRYAVMLPQNREIMSQVVAELTAKGAYNVVASQQAGTVSFVAPGALAEDVIHPYLIRLGRNASEVTLQVALVSVAMNDEASRGFDWSKFSFSFGDKGSETPSSGTGTGGAGAGSSLTVKKDPTTTLFSISNESSRLFVPSIDGKPLDILGAIRFLSSYGNTRVEQNVELRTLAGTRVNFRSGEKIPYVSGVAATTTGSYAGAGAVGSAETKTVDTGLQLDMIPNFESNGGLVTVSFNLQMVDLLEFVQLSAGNQLGSFTQPRTREQKLDDIVRIPVGETVVLGGIRGTNSALEKNGPFGMYFLGSRKRTSQNSAVFILLRPSVTIYRVAGLEAPATTVLSDLSQAQDGSAWRSPEEDARGTNLFGQPVNTPAKRSKPMTQPSPTATQGDFQ